MLSTPTPPSPSLPLLPSDPGAPTTFWNLGFRIDTLIGLVKQCLQNDSTIIVDLNTHRGLLDDLLGGQQVVIGEVSGFSGQINQNIVQVLSETQSLSATLTAFISTLSTTSPPLQVARLAARFEDLANLILALLQALQGVATSILQQQEIDLLKQELALLQGGGGDTVPASIGLDLSHVATRPQAVPTRRGP